jgi:hypothetical protein
MLSRIIAIVIAGSVSLTVTSAQLTFLGATTEARSWAGIKGVGIKDTDGLNINSSASTDATLNGPSGDIISKAKANYAAGVDVFELINTASAEFATPSVIGQQSTHFAETWLYVEGDGDFVLSLETDFDSAKAPFSYSFLFEGYNLNTGDKVADYSYTFKKENPTLFVGDVGSLDYSIYAFRLRTTSAGYRSFDAVSYAKLEVVPEPATMAVMGLGLAALLRRRRR